MKIQSFINGINIHCTVGILKLQIYKILELDFVKRKKLKCKYEVKMSIRKKTKNKGKQKFNHFKIKIHPFRN